MSSCRGRGRGSPPSSAARFLGARREALGTILARRGLFARRAFCSASKLVIRVPRSVHLSLGKDSLDKVAPAVARSVLTALDGILYRGFTKLPEEVQMAVATFRGRWQLGKDDQGECRRGADCTTVQYLRL